MSDSRLDALAALQPLPLAVAYHLADNDYGGQLIADVVAAFPGQPPASVRLAVATLLDTEVAYVAETGRLLLKTWAWAKLSWLGAGGDEPLPVVVTEAGRAAALLRAPVDLRDLDPVAT